MVFARTYDSRIVADDDFGPGWRLSPAEELLIDGDAATYVDEAGAQHAFAWTGMGWTASPPTPRHGATTLQFADVDGIRVAMLADGATVRTFEQADAAGARYVVGLVRTPARELVFDYDGGRLAAVSHGGATLFDVERDRDGRIAAVRDDHGRSVRYAYDSAGRLDTVRDIAGSDWRYRYRDDGLLGGAVDPEGRTYLAADYDAAGRVARAFADGRLHDYAYAPEGTTVAEDTGEVHTLTRAATGVTTALSSTTGVSWSLTLDGANRVSTLTLPERTIGYAYGGHGRVATMTVADSVSGTTRMHPYDYDAQGRLVSVSGGGADATVTYAAGLVRIDDGGEVFEYEADDRGRVAWVRRGADPEIRVERDGAGDIVEVSQGYRSVRFGRDALGRIVDASFADGSSARYFYDDLGSRRRSEYDRGGSVAYAYDRVGNMTGIETTTSDGTVRPATVPVHTVGPIERATGDGSATLDVEYGRLAFHRSGDATAATLRPTGQERVGRRQELREPVPTDAHLTVLFGKRRPAGQPGYRVVVFGYAGRVSNWIPWETVVPKLTDARRMLKAATQLFGVGAVDRFETPPNPIFQPSELLDDRLPHVATQRPPGAECAEHAPDAPEEVEEAPIVFVGTITDGDKPGWIVGVARSGYDASALMCEEHGGRHYIVGDIEFTDESVGYVSMRVPPPTDEECAATDRDQADVRNTAIHEAYHLDKYKEVLDKYQLMTRGPFTSAKCDEKLIEMKQGLADDLAAEKVKQDCHRDPIYASEPRRENYCDDGEAKERAGEVVYPDC